jgi:hypothetical protein
VDEVSFGTLMEEMAEQDLTELWPDVDRFTAAHAWG